MSVHHIIGSDDQKSICPYCRKKTDPKKWKSVFDHTNFHYKEHACSCGKKITIKIPFSGSGDDEWTKNIDELVEEADSELKKK